MAKKIDCTLQREEADRQRERKRQREGDDEPGDERAPARAEPIKREPDAIGADAEEHHMREGDDARIAEKQIVGGDEQDHHAGLGRDVERLGAREEEGRQRQREDDRGR